MESSVHILNVLYSGLRDLKTDSKESDVQHYDLSWTEGALT